MEETKLSKDINFLGLLRKTHCCSWFSGKDWERSLFMVLFHSVSFFLSLGDHAIRFIGIEKSQVK